MNFFLNLYIPPWLRKCFKFMVKITAKYIWASKNQICSFLLLPQSKTLPQVFTINPLAERNYLFLPNSFFWRSIFSLAERGRQRIIEMKKLPKLNLWGYWSQVLINSTIFTTFLFLMFVLLHHNLVSSMLRLEGILT